VAWLIRDWCRVPSTEYGRRGRVRVRFGALRRGVVGVVDSVLGTEYEVVRGVLGTAIRCTGGDLRIAIG
jgi:hypothetical protein